MIANFANNPAAVITHGDLIMYEETKVITKNLCGRQAWFLFSQKSPFPLVEWLN